MSSAFHSSDEVAISRLVESESSQPSTYIENDYEVNRCSAWINDFGFQKVALQFPDGLLLDSSGVSQCLSSCCPSVTFFILGDTSYGSCCVDEVAAEHYKADAVIHFGSACLSATRRIPVLYVFGQKSMDCGRCLEICRNTLPADDLILLLFDVAYDHCKGSSAAQEEGFHGDEETVLNRRFSIPPQWSSYTALFIGPEGNTLSSFILSMSSVTFYSYDPQLSTLRHESPSSNKALMKRFYMIEKAKDAQIVGIVVGTLGVAGYLSTINRLKALLGKAGKKTYTFSVGKLNPAKLGNFMEIDVFVVVSCPQNTIIDTSEYYKPIVSPLEMEMACNPMQNWGEARYSTDFSSVLPGGINYQPLPDKIEEKHEVSLVTGKLNTMGAAGDTSPESDMTTVSLRNSQTALMAHSADAGAFLQQRTWQGLERKLGETEVVKATEGMKGISLGYSNEPCQQGMEPSGQCVEPRSQAVEPS